MALRLRHPKACRSAPASDVGPDRARWDIDSAWARAQALHERRPEGSFSGPVTGKSADDRHLATIVVAAITFSLVLAVTKPWTSHEPMAVPAATTPSASPSVRTTTAVAATVVRQPEPPVRRRPLRAFSLQALLHGIPGGTTCRIEGGESVDAYGRLTLTQLGRCRMDVPERASFTRTVILAMAASFPGVITGGTSGVNGSTMWMTSNMGGSLASSVIALDVDEGPDLSIVTTVSERIVP